MELVKHKAVEKGLDLVVTVADMAAINKAMAGLTPKMMAEDIGVVMDAAGIDQAFVVGFSMGAYVAAHFAVAHPQRLLGLALCGLGAGADDPPPFWAGNLAMAETLRQHGMAPFVDEMARAPNRVQLQHKDPRGFEEFLQHLREMDVQGMANILQHCHARRPPIYELEASLRGLNVPTLVAVGDVHMHVRSRKPLQDVLTCLNPGLFLKRTLPKAGLWICPRTGHAINLEEPALFNAMLQSFIHAVEKGAWGRP